MVPLASPTSTMSPTPYWSSTRMKIPARKSFTRLWAPKPMATPARPAPAMSGPRLMPSSPRIVMRARPQITNDATERSTAPSVAARAADRSDTAPVESTESGRTAPTLVVRSRRFSRRLVFCSPTMAPTKRPMARRTTQLVAAATSSTITMEIGLANRTSASSASQVLCVRSSTSRQMNDGSGPQLASSGRGTAWSSTVGEPTHRRPDDTSADACHRPARHCGWSTART
jgi:hypothetical protein